MTRNRPAGPLGALPRLSGSARRALAVVGVLAALTGSALVAQAWALSVALSAVVLHRAAPAALGIPLLVLAVAVPARAALAWATDTVAARAAAGAKEELRAALLDTALARGPEWIADPSRPDHGSAGLTALATTGLDGLDAYFTRYLPALVTACVVPVEVGAWILVSDWRSALLIVVTVPLIPVFAWLIGRYTEGRVGRAADAGARLSGHLAELVRALPVLTAFRRAAAQVAAVRRVGEAYRRSTMATLRVAFLSALALELLAMLSVALVAVSVGLRLVDGGIGLATALTVLILAPECFLPLRAAGAAHHASEDGVEAVRRCADLLAEPDKTCARGGPVPEGVRRGRHGTGDESPSLADGPLVITGLSVRRRAALVPEDLSLTVRPGVVTRLTAPSGGGKSTTFGVLLGFVAPAAGSVTVGGVELSAVDPELWRRRVAWVPQHPAFTGGTVTAELELAVADSPDGPPTAEEIRCAARASAAEALLDRAVDTLSTGERQRVAVARALLRVRRGAELLLLDEPTAHLDPASAATVLDAVRAAAERGVAVLLAAHRSPDEVPPSEPVPARAVADSGQPHGKPALWRLLDAHTLAGGLLGAAALGSGAGLTATAAWLIATAAGQPPILTLSVAVVAVRTFGLARAVLRYTERLVSHDAAFRLAERLRVRLWQALVALGPSRTLGLRRGDGLRRLVDDTDGVRELVPRVLQPPLVALLVGAAAVTVQALILPAAGAVLAVALLAAGGGGTLVALAVERRASTRLAAGRRRVAAGVLGLFDAAADLLATGAHRPRRQELAAADTALRRMAARQAVAAGAANGLITLAIGAAMLGGTRLGATAAAAGRIGPVWVPVLALLPLAVAEAITPLPVAATQLGALRAAYARVHDVLTAAARIPVPTPDPAVTPTVDPAAPKPSVADGARRSRQGGDSGRQASAALPAAPSAPDASPASSGATASSTDGGIRLRGVDVRWPGAAEPVLRDVELTVEPGRRVLVLGPSGAGKSMFLALLLGFLRPEHGTALLPDRIAWCPQEPQLVSTTIRENLRLGDPHASDDRLRAALHVADLDDWADRLDARLGVGGAAVSGGEAQRLALARAVLGARDAPLLLLDEPTAHLDPPTAARVLARLRRHLPTHTVVHVTHRADEVSDADLVLEVRDGRVRLPALAGAAPFAGGLAGGEFLVPHAMSSTSGEIRERG